VSELNGLDAAAHPTREAHGQHTRGVLAGAVQLNHPLGMVVRELGARPDHTACHPAVNDIGCKGDGHRAMTS
jgi:hypothetical protein